MTFFLYLCINHSVYYSNFHKHHIYTERMMVSCFLWCLQSDLHEILHEGGPLDQMGWKIFRFLLPWQPLPWQPKNLLRVHKTPKRLWNSNKKGIGLERNLISYLRKCSDTIIGYGLSAIFLHQSLNWADSVFYHPFHHHSYPIVHYKS